MPKVHVKQSGGWGCSCKAHNSRYNPLDGLTRSTEVTAQITRKDPDGTTYFEAWTTGEHYVVVHSPRSGGGFCKHIPACAALLMGDWLTEAARQTNELRNKSLELEKQLKKKEIKQCSNS